MRDDFKATSSAKLWLKYEGRVRAARRAFDVSIASVGIAWRYTLRNGLTLAHARDPSQEIHALAFLESYGCPIWIKQ